MGLGPRPVVPCLAFLARKALVLLFGLALEVSSVLSPELPLELLLDLPEHESLLSSLLLSVLSQPVESLVLPELEELLELLLVEDDEELPELSPLLDELLSPLLDEVSPEEPLELSPLLLDDALLEDVVVVVSPPQLWSSFVVELVVPVLDAPQPSSVTTSSSPSSS